MITKLINKPFKLIRDFIAIGYFFLDVLNSRDYVHKKTGNIYKLFTVANNKSGREGFPPICIYMCRSTGTIYARPLDEFSEKVEIAHHENS